MNLRLIFCVAMGVFTTFIGFVMLLTHVREEQKIELPTPPNFSAIVENEVVSETGEIVTKREFTVTTKLLERPLAKE